MKFNNINKFDIKTFLSPFLSFLPRLPYLPRYNKIYDNAYDKYYYYNKEKFNNINKFNIKI